ncbi:MAG: WD40 repeat domain-containing protein [Lentisphaerae bacterium]|nr:MAG: WD40 repeat domain-containing protein [Lentisphaerota bacterium]
MVLALGVLVMGSMLSSCRKKETARKPAPGTEGGKREVRNGVSPTTATGAVGSSEEAAPSGTKKGRRIVLKRLRRVKFKPHDPYEGAFCSGNKRIVLSGRHFVLAEYPSLEILFVAPGAFGRFDLSPDGRYAVSEWDREHDQSIPCIIDMRTGGPLDNLRLSYSKRGDYRGGKFSPDGKYFYMWGEHGWVEKWDFESKRQVWAKRDNSLIGRGATLNGLEIDATGRYLLIHPRANWFRVGSVAILDAATGEKVHRFPGLAQMGKFAPGNEFVLLANADRVRKYAVGTWEPLGDPGIIDPPASNENRPWHLGIFPSGRWCYLVQWKCLHFWNTDDMSVAGKFRLLRDEKFINNIVIHPDEESAIVMVYLSNNDRALVMCKVEYE